MNTFQWLLVLGFPPAVAASTVQPDVFSAPDGREDTASDVARLFAGTV